MTVTVLDDEITSEEYTVTTKDLTGEDIKIIIGAEPKTSIKDFLDNIDNPNEYLKVYNKNDELVSSSDYESTYITTGSKVQLVINDHEYDEVIVVVRGDVNQDGKVDISDRVQVQSHILKQEYITGYRVYAADVVEKSGATLDKAIDISDAVRINSYILKQISSLNEEDGD